MGEIKGTHQPQEKFSVMRYTVKHHKISTSYIYFLDGNLAPRDSRFSERNGISGFKELSASLSSTPVYFMSTVVLEAVDIYKTVGLLR